MFLRRIKFLVVGFLGSNLARILLSTVRVDEKPSGYPKQLKREGKKVIYAFWHSFMLMPGYVSRNLGIKVLISRHTDGEYIAHISQKLGFEIVRGSTTRGGVEALLKMVKDVEGVRSFIITPDGPKGPRFVAQPGVIFLGQKTGLPIVPVSLGISNYWELPSWDKFRVPKPFSKATIIYGEPMRVPATLGKSEIEEYRVQLEKKLNEITAESERLVKC